jgi:hypothetical protein
MAVKKISVTFELDMEVFMKVLQHGNSAVRVDMYGDRKESPKLLAAPQPERPGAKKLMIEFMTKNKDRDVQAKELKLMLVENGYSPSTYGSQLHLMMLDGIIKRSKDGYRLTAKALANG